MPVFAQADILPRLITAVPAFTLPGRCEWPVLITAATRGQEWVTVGNGEVPAIKFHDIEDLSFALATMMSNGYLAVRITFTEPNGAVRRRELHVRELSGEGTTVEQVMRDDEQVCSEAAREARCRARAEGLRASAANLLRRVDKHPGHDFLCLVRDGFLCDCHLSRKG